ncbi:MAG TPA: ATP-dependent DNA helicase, partial [Bdellovibrionales bacterium]|nr:ATP-dependent DNA helicase [Bdellovibrionales bacterium]
SYYSPQLSSFVFELMKPGMERLPGTFAAQGRRLIDQCLLIIESHRPEGCTTSARVSLNVAAFMDHEALINEFLTSYLESDAVIEPQDPVLKLANTWANFVEAVQFEGDNFFSTYTYYPNGGTLKITCCDASDMLKENYASFAHVVGFSATLKPFNYYAKLSGLDVTTTKMSEFKSPFPKSNRKLLVIPQVSTKYSVRHANYSKIADGISRIASIKPGNYFVFFPSFDFLEHVAARVKAPGFKIVKQTREMRNAAVEDVIDQLKRGGDPILLFGVQGGVFSEGVDYPGDMAIGAIIVGPGLPTFDLERELLREFYEKRYGEGFGYAYVYPAMTKVVQSAGRVIRSETDRGLIVLMDNRFLTKPYADSMPADWYETSVQELVSREILKDIQNFWSGNQTAFNFDDAPEAPARGGADSFAQSRVAADAYGQSRAQEAGEEPQFSPEETSQ